MTEKTQGCHKVFDAYNSDAVSGCRYGYSARQMPRQLLKSRSCKGFRYSAEWRLSSLLQAIWSLVFVGGNAG